CDRIKVEPGDLLYFDTWGGGGWGDPLKRPAEQVGFDVAAGLVSVDGARRYGVVCNEDGEVDDGATEKLRSDMATERGDTLLFDFGGTTEELKARCEEETGLPAPAAPEFQNWFGSAA
ncbi:MAG: hydantoinase B/oxoprolinase family protein, partial [Gammaproteobacteria bacterium]|nr:hydantoinase B/oxoprolinase family protein [Gammaproteobacteria bacterium]